MLVVGTRPEAIKLSPVATALLQRGLVPTVLFTGQHPGLDPVAFHLDSMPSARLECPGLQDPAAHAGVVTRALLPLLRASQPDMVIVQGDTSSALGAALAAGLAAIPVAHVEAGLRSHNRRHPWPEEEFRVAIDRDSTLLFAPTALSAANLRRERLHGRIHVTGNTGIDAALKARGAAVGASADEPLLLVTCHRRENWGHGLDRLAEALRAIARQSLARIDVILHPNPILACRVRQLLAGCEGIGFRDPCSHEAAVEAMLGASLVLSDSGGMQEEAAALGVPLLLIRERTERPEAIACGNVELVGTEPERIVAAVRRRLARPSTPAPTLALGDGLASQRIAAIVEAWLAEKDGLAPAVPRLSPAMTDCPRQSYGW